MNVCFPLSPASQSLLPPLVHCPALFAPGFRPPVPCPCGFGKTQCTTKHSVAGEQGWRSGESTSLPPMWPGLDSRSLVICGLSLLLVLVLAPRVFLRVLRFSSLHKNQHFQVPVRPGRPVFTHEPLAREIMRLLPTPFA